MNKYLSNIIRPAVFVLAATLAQPSFAADENAQSNMEILTQKIKADKKLVIAANMELTDAEAKAFWPIYDAYQKDLQQINQKIVAAVNDYALAYNKGAVLDSAAKKLLDDSLAIELSEVNLKKSYASKLSKTLPSGKVARYIQLENKIRAIVRYELADSIPLVK